MGSIPRLFENNRKWAEGVAADDPTFFKRLAAQQSPEILWIGCSDSRVPANQVIGLAPGEVFVHRNVANVVVHTDFNCLSVMQYAVEVLQVKHIIVCGHYGCGGVAASMGHRQHGLIDNWLRHIKDVYDRHAERLDRIEDGASRVALLCELNVAAQVLNTCHTTIVQEAWKRKQDLTVHGVIYALSDGLLKDLGLTVTGPEDLDAIYRMD